MTQYSNVELVCYAAVACVFLLVLPSILRIFFGRDDE